jgi:rod shape-determining protein MreC
MRGLLDFFARNNYWFLFFGLETFSLILLIQFNFFQGSIWFTSANAVAGKVYEWESEVTAYFSLGEVNRALTHRNLVLEQKANYLQRLLQERGVNVEEKVDSVQKRTLKDYTLLDARVISNSIVHKNNFIVIDKGELDGIEEDMGVVCGTGVVGIVYAVSNHYSLVIPLLNPSCKISARLRNSKYFGSLQWSGKDPLHVYLNDIPRHASLHKGEVVETSGFSSIFPEGVFVGKIDKVFNSNNGTSYMVRVHLATDFARLRDVCVIKNFHKKEIMNLQEKAEALEDEL